MQWRLTRPTVFVVGAETSKNKLVISVCSICAKSLEQCTKLELGNSSYVPLRERQLESEGQGGKRAVPCQSPPLPKQEQTNRSSCAQRRQSNRAALLTKDCVVSRACCARYVYRLLFLRPSTRQYCHLCLSHLSSGQKNQNENSHWSAETLVLSVLSKS